MTTRFTTILTLILMLAACAPTQETPYSDREISALRAYNQAVVLIDVDKASGSGTFIAPDLVLTNHHVIRNATKITVRPYGKTLDIDATVVISDAALDLAVLRVVDYKSPHVAAISAEDLPPYTHVYALGHPIGLPLVVTDGRYQYQYTTLCGLLTTPIFFGNSGGSAVVYSRARGRMEMIGVPSRVFGIGQHPYSHTVCVVPAKTVLNFLHNNRENLHG